MVWECEIKDLDSCGEGSRRFLNNPGYAKGMNMNSVELFAGAGGLALGVSLAGFEHSAVIELNSWAIETLTENKELGFPLLSAWPIQRCDVREFDYSTLGRDVDLVAGGPPCQPFSLGGKHGGHNDSRDMFPASVAVVRKLKPKAFLFENVPGLMRPSFTTYFQYTLLQLSYPEIIRKNGERWIDHLARLERHKTAGCTKGLSYRIVTRTLNAADYGVPQKRKRVFIVGFRSDLGMEWAFPSPTHSFDSLLHSQWISGDYWTQHALSSKKRPKVNPRHQKRVERLRMQSKSENLELSKKPWTTVRDVLSDLPDPRNRTQSALYKNHNFQPGAKVYPGHTGSPLEEPAKTLKAGDHGVPGGENMMVLDDGDVRYFTVREGARLQTFHDDYVFHGSWTETMRQLGNAVPVELGRIIADSIAKLLK